MDAVRVIEVGGTPEEGLQTLFCTGNDSSVVTEEKTADDGDKHDSEQIYRISVLSVIAHMLFLLIQVTKISKKMINFDKR